METATQQFSQLKTEGIRFLADKGPAMLGAIVILIAGFMVARIICRLLGKWLDSRHMDPPVRMLFTRLTWLIVMSLFFMVALGTMGIAVGPLIALMSVAGVGIGLAMQGVLGNLVSGLLIIFTKPFRIGEYIEVVGNYGQVSTIELFSTTLLHVDQSRVVIPNRKISGEILHNYGTIRQHNITIGVAYNTNVAAAIGVITEILARNPRVLKNPVPVVAVSSFGSSSIEISIKPWSPINEFGPAGAEIKLAILDAFRTRKIEIPFPQMEVRMVGQGSMPG